MPTYRHATITGASSGIGRAFALELPAATNLLLIGRDAGRLEKVAAETARPGRVVETMVLDLTLDADRDRLVARGEEFATDLLINNAGSGRFGDFLEGSPEAELETVLVNVVAVVDLTRRLLPGMLARAEAAGRRCGLIVVCSTAAFAPVPFLATYAATKVFDLHFTEALAEELRARPVDVVALCPGPTQTAFGARAGYRGGDLPGGADPRAVAADGLAALGCETVRIAGRFSRLALRPVVGPRRLVTGAVGTAMRWFGGCER